MWHSVNHVLIFPSSKEVRVQPQCSVSRGRCLLANKLNICMVSPTSSPWNTLIRFPANQNEGDQLVWTVQRELTSWIQGWVTVLTVMRDNSPGHGRCVYSPDHPEHAEPTEVLATLLLGQKFRVVGKHDGNWATDPAKIRYRLSPELNCV